MFKYLQREPTEDKMGVPDPEAIKQFQLLMEEGRVWTTQFKYVNGSSS